MKKTNFKIQNFCFDKSKILVATLTLVMASNARAQDTFAFSGFPIISGFLVNNPLNPSFTFTSNPVGYQLGSKVTVNAASLTKVTTSVNTFANETRIRLRNSAFPSDLADVQIFSTGGYSGTLVANATNTLGTVAGSLVGKTIPASSTWTVQLYETHDDTPVGTADSRWLSLNITTQVPAAPTQFFSFSGPIDSIDTQGSTSNIIQTSAATASPFIFGNLQFQSSTWTRVHTSSAPSHAAVRVTHSLLPGYFSDVQFNLSTSTSTPQTTGFSESSVTSTGGLLDKIIPTGGNWRFEFFENVQNGPNFNVEARWSNLNFGWVSRGVAPTYLFQGTNSGPISIIDDVRDSSNSVISLGAVAADFVLGSNVYFAGLNTLVHTSTQPLDVGIRLRNSAYPFEYADFTPHGLTAYSTNGQVGESRLAPIQSLNPTGIGTDSLATLVGKNIPAGSTWTAEFYDRFQNGLNDVAESTMSNVVIGLISGTALAVATPPVSTNISLFSAANGFTLPTFTTSSVQWYKIVLPFDIAGDTGKFLDIYTEKGASNILDTEIGLYNSLGQLLNNDDDDGEAKFSQLSIGTTSSPRPPTGGGADVSLGFDGRDREGLKSGTYYLAVGAFNVSFGALNFGAVSSGASFTTGAKLFIKTNVATSTLVQGTVNLQDLTADEVGKSVNYKVLTAANVEIASGEVILGTGGTYSFHVPDVTSGSFKITMKASHWLRQGFENIVFDSPVTQNFDLLNGDVDNDNFIGLDDFNALSSSFNLGVGDAGFNVNADLDGDGFVGLDDFNILSNNFNTSGYGS